MDYDGLDPEEICGDAKVKGPRPHDISGDPTCRRGIDVWRAKILKMNIFTRCGKSWYGIHGIFGSRFGATLVALKRWKLAHFARVRYVDYQWLPGDKKRPSTLPTFWPLWIGFVSWVVVQICFIFTLFGEDCHFDYIIFFKGVETTKQCLCFSHHRAGLGIHGNLQLGNLTFEHDRPGTARPVNMSGEVDYTNSTVLDPWRWYVHVRYKCIMMMKMKMMMQTKMK